MEQEIVNDNTPNVETDDQPVESTAVDETDVSALKEKLTETEAKNRQLFERAKKAEGFVLKDGHWIKPEKPAPKPDVKVEPKASTSELDETQLDYLDLKGISESDEIDVIQAVMRKTGQTVRQALKDEYVQAKLKDLKAQKEVKNAMPSSTKRAGSGSSNNLDLAIAKFEQSDYKDLPEDFELRRQVIDSIYQKKSTNKPAWH